MPYFAKEGIPTLSVVYDLQYAEYPYFFDERDRAQRHNNFVEACKHAARLICISDFVRESVLKHAPVASEKVKTIHVRLGGRLASPSRRRIEEALADFRLSEGRYLLYPANYWEHKNHRMLFVAMSMFYARHPQSDLRLVCTGAPGVGEERYREDVRRMGLQEKIAFLGFLKEDRFSALMHACLAVIVPSLYEGFGIPVIEAMAAGRPVLCSNVTSLPEVAGDAALFFDPKLPGSICTAIERIETEETLITSLVERGKANVTRFTNSAEMAAEYLEVIREMLQQPSVG